MHSQGSSLPAAAGWQNQSPRFAMGASAGLVEAVGAGLRFEQPVAARLSTKVVSASFISLGRHDWQASDKCDEFMGGSGVGLSWRATLPLGLPAVKSES
jgi:hypothetical protein